MTSWCWLDGAVLPTADARLPVTDHGLTVGDGIFETMKVVAGTPFALTRHMRRLRRSAAALGLDVGRSDGDLRSACSAVIDAALADGAEVGRLRLTVTGGPGPAGSERGTDGPTVLVVTGPPATWPPAAAVATVPFTRNPTGGLAGVKSTSYAENVLALARAQETGAGEAIFADVHGRLSEGTGSNVFVVGDGHLLTPSLSTACLAGITRELVLEVCPSAEETGALTLDDLRSADEAFLTSSTRDVQPIASVDGVALAAAPGPVTRSAIDAFAHLQATTLDP